MKHFTNEAVQTAADKFAALIRGEESRISRMQESAKPIDFASLDQIIVGLMPGDGIGRILIPLALKVMDVLMKEELASGNRRAASHWLIFPSAHAFAASIRSSTVTFSLDIEILPS